MLARRALRHRSGNRRRRRIHRVLIVYHRRFPICLIALRSSAFHVRTIRTAHPPRMTSPVPSDTALRPLPIDALTVPAALDGRTGTNRSSSAHPQIAATNDLDAVRAWLARFVDTPTTFQNYRKEAERLLLWAVIACGKPLSSLTHEDLVVYRQFLLAPAPAELWCANGGRKHPRDDPRWRPFYGPLSAASQRQALVILNVMFSWLVQAGYLAGNPLALSRQRQRRHRASRAISAAAVAVGQGRDRRDAARRRASTLPCRSRALAVHAAVSRRAAHHRSGRHDDGPVFLPARCGRARPLVARRDGQRRPAAARAGHRRDDGRAVALPMCARPARVAVRWRGHAARAAGR